MHAQIVQNIIDYWKRIIDDDSVEITPQSNLMDDLSLSSLEMFNALIMLEDNYGIEIPEKYLRRMISIDDVATVIEEIICQPKQ